MGVRALICVVLGSMMLGSGMTVMVVASALRRQPGRPADTREWGSRYAMPILSGGGVGLAFGVGLPWLAVPIGLGAIVAVLAVLRISERHRGPRVLGRMIRRLH